MYTPCYPGGWKDGSDGDTAINADALNHMENGIKAACTLAVSTFLVSIAAFLTAIRSMKK